MLTNWVLKLGGYQTKKENRSKISYYASLVGLTSNIILAVAKVIIGLLSGSISIMADAVNNLMDTTSSLITIIGVKLANLPPDEEHPYGHGRIEYITALIVSCLVIIVGLQFVKSSYQRLREPTPVAFHWVTFFILSFSIVVKFLQSRFNRKIADIIDSVPLKATAADSMGDVLVTSVVLLSFVANNRLSVPIDGIVGIGVSIFIIFSGLQLIKETMSSLIGEVPSAEFIEEIHDRMCEYEYVSNVHDIIVNSYGPEKSIVVLDAEFPYYLDLETVHEVIDKAERELSEKLNIQLIVHADPVGNPTKKEREIGEIIRTFIDGEEGIYSFHDLTLLDNGDLHVDITADGNKFQSVEEQEIVIQKIQTAIRENVEVNDMNIEIDLRYKN